MIEIQARRMTGGAMVSVTRGELTRQYRVGLRRFARLKWLACAWRDARVVTDRNAIFIRLESPTGYHDALAWILRHGSREERRAMGARG
jgi:hypothetical protein